MYTSRLLDIQLKETVETGDVMRVGENNPIVEAVLALLQGDGLSS